MNFFKPDIFALMLSILICFPLTQANDGNVGAFSGDIVRLHIIANSDSSFDQELKLKVRDAVLAYSESDITGVKSTESLNQLVSDKKQEICAVAEEILHENGFDGGVAIETGVFDFPARTYGSLFFPKGKYNAVRIIIGNGSGHNWWCVMYPPLCFTDKNDSALSDEALKLLSDNTEEILTKPKYKLRLAELFGGK